MPRRRGRAGVIEAPFRGNPAVADRLARLTDAVGAAVVDEVEALVAVASADPLDASTIGAGDAAALVARHGLESARELALLALPVARAMARPPISGFRVAAIGIEADGDLVLGGNLEFPGTELGTTIHAEGFVGLRARRRGRRLAILVVPEAHPCAHCRQTLAEASDAAALAIVDLLGNEVSLEDLYPWPFVPSALQVAGDVPGAWPWAGLRLAGPTSQPPEDVLRALLDAGARAHAPYSRAPSAVALRLRDERIVSAGAVESVAFNPSVSATQAALVELAAARADGSHIVEAWLGRTAGGPIDPEPGFRALVGAVAPGASVSIVEWQPADGAA